MAEQHPSRPPASRGRLSKVLALAAAGWWLAGAALAETGLPLPRFVSLHAPKVNVRTGPGVRYPVDWVLLRKGMPVEIVAEFENWRKIRDWQGTEGWVHQSMLSGTRTAVVMAETRTLRRSQDPASPVIARVEPSAIGRILSCEGTWCRLDVAGFKGWIRRDEIWGIGAEEKID